MARAWRISALADRPLLLDTHVFAWWMGAPERIGAEVQAAIMAPGSVVLISVASIWEMALKHRRGRWPEAAAIVADPAGQLAAEQMRALPISLAHARGAGVLDWTHGDPFDRMLAAQAIAEDATLITADRAFAALPESAGLRILWN